jgi:hypothetical protein
LVTFRQAPMLATLVASGELSPVEERLPDDPMVVEPIDEIGIYGGTARLFFAGENLINVPEGVLRPGPQMRLNLPNWAEYASRVRQDVYGRRRAHAGHGQEVPRHFWPGRIGPTDGGR